MIEAPNPTTEVLEHYGTWLTRPGGYVDVVLRGPRPPRPGLPGPLHIEGMVIPFSGFLPSALQWSSEAEHEDLEARLAADAIQRTLVGSFTWGDMNYMVSFVYFEDITDPAQRNLAGTSPR